jgi:hypothetical protein
MLTLLRMISFQNINIITTEGTEVHKGNSQRNLWTNM